MLFLAIGFIAYTVIQDQQQRQASFERFKAIAQYTEESRAALEGAKRQAQVADEANQNALAVLVYMDELNRSMKTIAELLQINRERQRAEHAAIMTRAKSQSARSPQTCYELRPVTKKFGTAEVTVNEYVKIPCT